MWRKSKKRKMFKANKSKKYLLVLFCFISLTMTSIAYAAYKQLVDAEIVSKIYNQEKDGIFIKKITNVYGCGYDLYDVEKTDNSITINIELLELDCSVFYEIEIQNNSDSAMQLVSIVEKFDNNKDIIFEPLSFEKDYFILSHEKVTMLTEVKYDSSINTLPNNVGNNAIIEFTWEELEETDLAARIIYNEVNMTNKNVVAKLEFNQKDISIVNNNNNNEYKFDDNGEFIFEYIDQYGKINEINAQVSWIDKNME